MRVLAILILLVAAWSCNPKDKTKEPAADAPAQESLVQQDTTQQNSIAATPDSLTESENSQPALILDSLEWTLSSMIENGNTTQISNDNKVTATFQGGKVFGSGGCNVYNGSYSATRQGSINISQLASSKKFCDRIMGAEKTFFKIMEGAETWKMTGNRLELKGSAGQLQFIHTELRVIPN